jgi:hypothetical protein
MDGIGAEFRCVVIVGCGETERNFCVVEVKPKIDEKATST